MRNILRYIVCACLALALGGCIKDEIVGNSFCREGLLSLNIGINETRAAGDNDNGDADLTLDQLPLNENRIDNYEVFLFASGATGEAEFSAYFSGVNATDSTTNNAISVPAGALAELFGSGDTCNIYVVANLGKSLATELNNASTPLTLANLKDYIVSADFTTPVEYEDQDLNLRNSAPIQPNFVMDSSGTDTVTKSGNNLSGEVYITRAASKISFMAYIGESMTIDGKVWIPDLENIKVAFNNVVEKGAIDNGSDTEDTFTMPQVEGLYKNLSGVQLLTDANVHTQTPEFEGEVQGVSSWQKVDILVPFYTYSSIWNATENKVNPSIVLTVPWFVKDNKSTTLTNYNYTIPLTAANGDLKLVRNKHYRIALRVGVLGDLDQLASSEFSYEVLDWVGNDINVDLSRPKYFVVDKEYVEVYNEPSYSVDFSASDIVSAEILSIIKPDYSGKIPKEDNYIFGSANNTEGVLSFSPSSGNTNPFTLVVDNDTDDGDGKSITLTHTLDNDMNSNGFDYVPYTVVVRATMTITDSAGNTSTMVKDITFKQYPAIYLYADTNASFVSEGSDNAVNNDPANTFVNGWNRRTSQNGSESIAPGVTTTNPTKPGTVWGLYSSSNSNPNQYVVTISSLDSSLPYIIADPRSRTSDVSSLNIGTIAESYAVDYDFNLAANKRQMQNYYRTNDSRTNGSTTASSNPNDYITAYHIAPKYRIASSYSVTTGVSSLDIARQRCATYQENGYPAGRWRMPTYAEVAFICLMSNKGMIPDLFDDNTSYWCAHGQFYPSGGEVKLGGSGASSIRCVYDEWYWGSERLSTDTNVTPNYSQFVWGDMKIW